MISRIWTGSLLLLLCVAIVAFLHACMYEREFHPYRAFWRKFRKLPWWKQLAAVISVGFLWAYAGEKPNVGNFTMATLRDAPMLVTDEWTEFMPITSTNTTRTLDGDDFRRGFVFVRIETNCPASIFNSQPSIPNAQFSGNWRAFGAASDWVYASVEWKMENGKLWGGILSNEVTRLRIHSDGWVETGPTDILSVGGGAWGHRATGTTDVSHANFGVEVTIPACKLWRRGDNSGIQTLAWR